MHKPRLTTLIRFSGGCCKEDLVPLLLKAGAGLKSEQNKHHHPNGHDQKAANQAWTGMGKAPALTWAGQSGEMTLVAFLSQYRLEAAARESKKCQCEKAQSGPLAAGRDSQQAATQPFSRDLSPEADTCRCSQPIPSPPRTLACFIPSSTDAPMLLGLRESQGSSLVLQQRVLPTRPEPV